MTLPLYETVLYAIHEHITDEDVASAVSIQAMHALQSWVRVNSEHLLGDALASSAEQARGYRQGIEDMLDIVHGEAVEVVDGA